MFGFDEAQDNYQQVQQDDNQAELSHEVLAGGASFLAMHEFEKHQRNEGKEVSHGFAKEMLATFAGVEVDRLAETKGADYIDREKAKRQATKNAHDLYDQHYGDEDQYNPNSQRPNDRLQQQFGNDSYGGGYGGNQGGYGGNDRY